MKLESLIPIAWLILAIAHFAPVLPLIAPESLLKLYGVAPAGDVGLLLRHRALLFAIVCGLCVWAAFDAGARPAALASVGISVVGFLGLYAFAGFPMGPLRTIALVDAAVLPALAVAAWGVIVR